MNRSSRRAMTLIEVLAATVLLAILGSVCASLLRSVPVLPTKFDANATTIDMLALGSAADELLDDRELRERLVADPGAAFTMPWPDDPARPPIQIRRVEHEPAAEKPEHAWVAFSCEHFIVWRWLELPRESPTP
ncbi:MAG: type II secretion system protein [Phycisphaerales bacterium]|nr:type II secretion system protein [Phycisphaerales bacterium]